jgi:hypothetical protein
MISNKRIVFSFDLIREIQNIVFDNEFFRPSDWCERDAEILESAARIIREGISKREKD